MVFQKGRVLAQDGIQERTQDPCPNKPLLGCPTREDLLYLFVPVGTSRPGMSASTYPMTASMAMD